MGNAPLVAAVLAERARALSGLSQGILEDNRELVLLLAIEAAQLAKASTNWAWSLGQPMPALHRALGHSGWDEATGILKSGAPHQPAWLSSHGGVLTVGGNGQPTLWDASAGPARTTLEGQAGDVLAASWAPDRSLISVASRQGWIIVWDSSSMTGVRRFRAGMRVVDLRWSPDESRLSLVGGIGQVAVWDQVSASPLFSWRSANGALLSAQ